jgi:hypothetical protein
MMETGFKLKNFCFDSIKDNIVQLTNKYKVHGIIKTQRIKWFSL